MTDSWSQLRSWSPGWECKLHIGPSCERKNPFTIALKRIKYLGIHLTNEVQKQFGRSSNSKLRKWGSNSLGGRSRELKYTDTKTCTWLFTATLLSQKSRNSPNVHQLIYRQTKCGKPTQGNSVLLCRRMTYQSVLNYECTLQTPCSVKEASHKSQTLRGSIFMSIPNWQTHRDRK